MIAWYIVPYKRRDDPGGRPGRYCAMDDFTTVIRADGGDWAETEVLGGYAIVKVRATFATVATIAAAPGFQRIPVAQLDTSLSSLSKAVKTALKAKLQTMGYSVSEIAAALPNDLGTYTLRQLLTFAARRRLKPRYDLGSDTIVLDGPIQPVRPLDSVDGAIV